jgi:hypothetical protein
VGYPVHTAIKNAVWLKKLLAAFPENRHKENAAH